MAKVYKIRFQEYQWGLCHYESYQNNTHKRTYLQSALFSSQCLFGTWVTAILHIWGSHSCDKRLLMWGMAIALVTTPWYLFSHSQKNKCPHILQQSFFPAWTPPEKLLDPFLEDIFMWPLLDGQGVQGAHNPTSSLYPLKEGWTLVNHIGSRCTNKILSPQNLQLAPLPLQTEGIIKQRLS